VVHRRGITTAFLPSRDQSSEPVMAGACCDRSGRRQQRMDGYSVVTEVIQLTQRQPLRLLCQRRWVRHRGGGLPSRGGCAGVSWGHNSPGLPSPQSSNDPDTRKVQLPDAFGIEMLTDLTRPTALIASTSHSLDDLYGKNARKLLNIVTYPWSG